MKNPSSERGRACRGELTLSKFKVLIQTGGGGFWPLSLGDQSLFWQRQCLNIFIKRPRFPSFDGAAASFLFVCQGSPEFPWNGFPRDEFPRDEFPRGLHAPQLHTRHPAGSCKPRGQLRGPLGPGISPVPAQGGLGWHIPAPGQPKPLSPHLGKTSVDFCQLSPSFLDPLECPRCRVTSDFTPNMTKRSELLV